MAKTQADLIREAALEDLVAFAYLVGPGRCYGDLHEKAMRWLARGDCLDQLLLLPRGHLKSHLMAVWCAWWITKHPETTILYGSATEDLAVGQLSAIKNILASPVYLKYWPEMVNEQETLRERWAMKDIKVDHPRRKELGVRDSTVAARGAGANVTGLHCDVLVLDDMVVPENAYTEEGRKSVRAAVAQLASVKNPGAFEKVAGTRYHPNDIYSDLLEMEVEQYDDDGNPNGSLKAYSVFSEVVEQDGVFCWPRQQHPGTKKWYGYDLRELARIRAKYFGLGEQAQYYAQYYNNPNAEGSDRHTSDSFQYYDRRHLTESDGEWYINGKPLAVFCGGDIAFTVGKNSDFTAFAVIGIDAEGYAYILDLVALKTDRYEKFYTEIEALYMKWRFRHIKLETNAGANLVVKHVQDKARENGHLFIVEGKPSRGDKIDRANIMLHPRYANKSIYHFKGGIMSEYEEQVILARPKHDDIRDAVAVALEISKPPAARRRTLSTNVIPMTTHQRFGGRIR